MTRISLDIRLHQTIALNIHYEYHLKLSLDSF